ncbi:hypothetical protein M0804_013197 [Polistes exclamans]|nr:hypothetical protein M0804_013197 [Polistes exclamans]
MNRQLRLQLFSNWPACCNAFFYKSSVLSHLISILLQDLRVTTSKKATLLLQAELKKTQRKKARNKGVVRILFCPHTSSSEIAADRQANLPSSSSSIISLTRFFMP